MHYLHNNMFTDFDGDNKNTGDDCAESQLSDDMSSSGPTTTEDITEDSSLLDLGGSTTPTSGDEMTEIVEDYFSHSANEITSDMSSFEEIDPQELGTNDTVGKISRILLRMHIFFLKLNRFFC